MKMRKIITLMSNISAESCQIFFIFSKYLSNSKWKLKKKNQENSFIQSQNGIFIYSWGCGVIQNHSFDCFLSFSFYFVLRIDHPIESYRKKQDYSKFQTYLGFQQYWACYCQLLWEQLHHRLQYLHYHYFRMDYHHHKVKYEQKVNEKWCKE